MGAENLKEGGIITEQASRLLQTGEIEKALELMERKFGPQARALMENALKNRNMSPDELAGTLSKVSDILEDIAEKISKMQQVEDQKNVAAAEKQAKENAVKAIEAQLKAAESQKKMEERLKTIEEIKQQIKDKDKEKEKLEKEHSLLEQKPDSKEKRKKLKEIDEKIKQLERRKKELARKREKIEKALQKMQNKKVGKEQEKASVQGERNRENLNDINRILGMYNSRDGRN